MSEENKPALLAPGDPFTVEYGGGKRVTVVALSLSKQRKLAALVKSMILAEGSGDALKAIASFDAADEAVRMAIPDVSDEFMETIDASDAVTIASACLGKQSVEDEDKKKSE